MPPIDFTPDAEPIAFTPDGAESRIDFQPDPVPSITVPAKDDSLADQFKGVGQAFQRGVTSGLRAVDVLGELTDRRVPTIRQGRAAYERAMHDPRYMAQLSEASRLELEDPAAGAKRAAQAEQVFGPEAKLEQIRRPIVTEQEARHFDIAQATEKLATAPRSQAMHQWENADNSNWWQVFAADPVEITANIIAESFPQSAVGSAAGAALGSRLGAPGMAVGVGAGSYATEYANSLLQSAAESGFDLSKPEAVKAFFASPQAQDDAKAKAIARGVPIAVMDAATAGLAGKFLGPAVGKGVRQVATGTAKEIGMQMGGGMAGELGAQVGSGDPINFKEIAAEGIGELGGAPVEAVGNIKAERARTPAPPKTSAVPPPPPKIDLADLQAALRGNQVKATADRRPQTEDQPVPETGTAPPETRNPKPETTSAPAGPLRFRAIVEEGKPASEMVIQPLTEELYDAVIHVEGLTPEFDQFRAEHPEATHLSRMLLPTGKFSGGHKFGPLNELLPPGIGTKWEIEDGRSKMGTEAQPRPPISDLPSPPSGPALQPPPAAAATQPPTAPAPVADVSPAPAPALRTQDTPSSPAGASLNAERGMRNAEPEMRPTPDAPEAATPVRPDAAADAGVPVGVAQAAPLTPPTPATTLSPAGPSTITAGTVRRGTQAGEAAPTSLKPTTEQAGAAEPGGNPGSSPVTPFPAGRPQLAAANRTRIKNAKGVKRSSLSEDDGVLFTFVHGLGHKLPYFKPDNFTVRSYKNLLGKARRNEPLTADQKAKLERWRSLFPHNYEDNYGADGAVMEAAYKAAQEAGLATELFREQAGAHGGESDTDLSALRDKTGKDYTLRQLFELAEQVANAHAERVSGRAEAKLDAAAEAQVKADEAFKRAQNRPGNNTVLVPPDDIREGMSYTLEGHKLRVTDIETDDAGRVVVVELDDGKKYLTQRIYAEDGLEVPALRADTGSATGTVSQKRAEQGEDGPVFSRKAADVNRELNELKAKPNRTAVENARITALENELGQQDLFAVETKDAAEIDREAQRKRDKAELERRRAARLQGGSIETTDNLFGERNEDKAGQGMFFSRGTGAGLTVEQVEQNIAEVTKDWQLPFRIEVVQSAEDLPAGLRERLGNDTSQAGIYQPGQGVFLIAENLSSPAHALRTVLHETIGHFGIETMMGDEFNDFARAVWRSFQGTPELAAVVRDYAPDFANGRTPTTDYDQRLVAREIIARHAETLRERSPNLWQQLVAAVRRFLRDTVGWKLEVSENDIMDALRRAEAMLRNSQLSTLNSQLVDLGNGVRMTPGARLVDIRPAPLASITAHHGTPHQVDKFSTEKIGTGEGAQVYGWGLYFAENEEVAIRYKESLGTPTVESGKLWQQILKRLRDLFPDTDARNLAMHILGTNESRRRSLFPELSVDDVGLFSAYSKAKNGNTYTVTLDVEPEDLLDWDKPLSEQSEKVRKVLPTFGNRTGAAIYLDFVARHNDAPNDYRLGSEALASLGIKGIRYLDQGSRPNEVYYDEGMRRWLVVRNTGGIGKDLVSSHVTRAEAERAGLTYNYVIFNEDDIRITHQNGQPVATAMFSRGTQPTEPLAEKPEVKNLVVAHNLSAEKLRHALKVGGFPVPSLAVIRTDRSQFDSFGDVTLLGPPDLVDNKRDKAAKVFNADVYSPRYPTVKYLLDDKAKKRVREAIGPMLDKLPADRRNDFSVWNALTKVEDKGLVPGILEDETMAAAFLMDRGHAVNWTPVSEDSKRYQSSMSRADARDMVRQTYEGNKPVDSPLRAEFKEWIRNLVAKLDLQPTEKIFAGFTNSGNRRYLPHDLDTVVRLMKKELKDGEGFNYGVPSVRAKVAKQFRTIAAMQAAREDIITREAMDKVKEDANAEFERLHNEAMPYRSGGKNSGYGTMDAFSDDLKAMAEGDFKHLSEMYPGGEPFAQMRDFLEKLKNLPTEYFEAKVQRAVSLQEFSAAVVPSDLPSDLSEALRKRGLDVVEYQGGDKAARRAAVQSAAEGGGIAFSRVTPPTEPLAELKARRDEAASRGITYAAQEEKLRSQGKNIPDSLKKAKREQANDFKEATFAMLRHPDYVAEQVRAVDAKLDELNTLKERQRLLKQQGTDLESDARARLAELEHWLPDETGEDAVPFQHADEFAGIPPSLIAQAIERTPGLKHFVTKAEKEAVAAILNNPNLTPEQKQRRIDDLESARGRQLAALPEARPLPPDGDVALATSTTLSGNADTRTWWQEFQQWLRKFASPTPEIPLTGPQARWNTPMRRFLDRIRAGGITAQRDAETMTQHVMQPLLDLPRKALDPNALARHRSLAKKLQFEQRRFDDRVEAMRAEIDSLEQGGVNGPLTPAERAAIRERREALAEFEGNPPAKIAELQAQLTEAEAKLAENPMRLFNLAALYRDYVSRYQMLQPKQKGEFKLPGGLNIARVVSELDRVEKAIEASPHKSAINESLDRHYRLMAQMEQSMTERGLLIPAELKNKSYFPHQVLDFTSQHLGRLMPTTEERFRGYLVEPTGSRKPIETDYLQAVYRHVAQVLTDNAHLDAVEQVVKPLDISEKVKERVEAKAAASGRTAGKFEWRSPDNLPPGYRAFDAGKLSLRMGLVLDPQTLANALGIALKSGDVVEQMKKLGVDFTVSPEMLQEALVAGEKPTWILPNEIADALDGLVERQRAEDNLPQWQRKVRQIVGLWKLNTLFAPWHYVRYEWGNTLSDVVDKVGGADPAIAKYLPRAFKEAIAFADKTGETPEIRAAFEHRVLDSVTFAEVGKVVDSPAFAQLRTDTQRALGMAGRVAKDTTMPLLPIVRLLSAANVRSTIDLSRLRESAFRYAKFLADLERIRNGQQPVYAGAYWKDVEALPTPEEKAAAISRKTFGDYGDLSVNGQRLRQNLIPFYSWTEINFRYHANLLKNFRDAIVRGDYGGARESGRAWAAYTALRLLLPYAAVHLWNTVGGAMAGAWDDDDDLESTLSDQDRRRFHLVLGKDARGQTKVVYAPTAFSDVMSWFGGDNAARLMAEYARGDITFERMAQTFAKDYPGDLLNKVAQSTGPVGKGAFIAASGKQPFPDVTNMRSVSGREKFFAVVQTMTDREGTDLLRRAFDNDYYARPAGEVMQQLVLQIRRRDPEQWAFYEVKQAVSDWKFEKTGKRFEAGDYSAPEAQALRGFRRAVYLGDVAAAQRFYARLLSFGYTAERLRASIRNQAPLAELNDKERKEFIGARTPAEREQIRRALQYWERLGALQGQEKGLFPPKGARTFTPQPERLDRAMQGFERQPDAEVRRKAERLLEQAGR